MKRTLCIGHRGAKGYVPENTLPSFERAIEIGCDWIELDVYLIENELVVFHDKLVDRTTNGSGELAEYSLQKLRNLDAGDGAQIPLLVEVLAMVDKRCGVNVELKGANTADATSKLLLSYIDAGWPDDQFLVSSFNHQELAHTDNRLLRGMLCDKPIDGMWQRASELNAWSVNFNWRFLTPEIIKTAHERGYRVLTYTVNEPVDIANIMAMSVDGIFSDYPDRVLAAVPTDG